MITKDKLFIIATVPLAMVINLSILSYCFGDKTEYGKPNASQTEKATDNKQKSSAPSATVINFANPGKKLSVSHFPDPPAHTFVGNETREMAEEQENIESKGVIVE